LAGVPPLSRGTAPGRRDNRGRRIGYTSYTARFFFKFFSYRRRYVRVYCRRSSATLVSTAVQACATNNENARASVDRIAHLHQRPIVHFHCFSFVLLYRLQCYCTRVRARRLPTRNYSHFTGGALLFFLQHSSRHAWRATHYRRSAVER